LKSPRRAGELTADTDIVILDAESRTLAQEKIVRLVCDKCGRRGQYQIDRLLEQYGPDIAMPDLHHELAQCRCRRDMSNPVRCSTLID